jgi:hypothetical protein
MNSSTRAPAYSMLTLASFTTFALRSVSVLIWAAIWAELLPIGIAPISSIRFRNSGEFTIFTISAFRRATTSLGVAAGSNIRLASVKR